MGWNLQGNIKGPSSELSLPAYAGNRLKQWDPMLGVYNLKQANTKRFRNAVRKAQFGVGPCHITNISDSSSSGFIGGQSAAGYDLQGAWPMTLRDVLVRDLGIPSGGTGLVPLGQWPLNDSNPLWAMGNRWVFAGTVTNNGGYITITGTTSSATFLSDQSGTQVDVMYYNTSGAFNVYVDDVLVATPPRTGGYSFNKYTLTGLSDTPHTIKVVPTTATAVYLMGVAVGSPSKGIHMHNLGIYGEKAYTFDTATDQTLAAVNRPVYADAYGGSTNNTDLLILKIGANDRTAYLAATPTPYTTKQAADALKISLRNLRNKPKYAGADVLLVMQNNADDDFSAMYYDLADELDCPLIDTRFILTSTAQAIADGIITPLDNVHYNARGQRQVGLSIAAALLSLFGDVELPQQGAGLAALPKPGIVDQIKFPLYIAHRGGHLIHGEHSMDAYEWAASQGYGIECDVQVLSDGGLACCHDATTTRTMKQVEGTAQSTISAITTANWMRNYRILPEIEGGDYERPTLFTEVLDKFGGRVFITPEIKVTAARIPVCDEIVKRGLERSCLVQSFDLNDVRYALSRGIEGIYLNPTETAAVLTGYGLKYVGVPSSATTTYLDSLVAAGLKVILYTVNSRVSADAFLAANRAHGFFSDDPDHISGRGDKSYSDPFRSRIPPVHTFTPANYFRENLIFKGGGIGQRILVSGNSNTGFTCDWCPPIASGKANVYFEVEFGEVANSQTRWVGIFFGTTPTVDDAFTDSTAVAGQAGWHCLARRDGSLEIFQVVSNTLPGAASAAYAGVAGTVAAAAGKTGTHQFKFTRSATNITLTNLTLGTTVTFANAALNTNARFQFNFNGTEATVRSVRVEEIP